MVRRYPHTARITTRPSAVQNGNGDFVSGSATELEVECRAEAAGTSGTVRGEGGEQINYQWTVFLPLQEVPILVGAEISVSNGGQELLLDTVKRYLPGQRTARLLL